METHHMRIDMMPHTRVSAQTNGCVTSGLPRNTPRQASNLPTDMDREHEAMAHTTCQGDAMCKCATLGLKSTRAAVFERKRCLAPRMVGGALRRPKQGALFHARPQCRGLYERCRQTSRPCAPMQATACSRPTQRCLRKDTRRPSALA